jgi:hypothetical protein
MPKSEYGFHFLAEDKVRKQGEERETKKEEELRKRRVEARDREKQLKINGIFDDWRITKNNTPSLRKLDAEYDPGLGDEGVRVTRSRAGYREPKDIHGSEDCPSVDEGSAGYAINEEEESALIQLLAVLRMQLRGEGTTGYSRVVINNRFKESFRYSIGKSHPPSSPEPY